MYMFTFILQYCTINTFPFCTLFCFLGLITVSLFQCLYSLPLNLTPSSSLLAQLFRQENIFHFSHNLQLYSPRVCCTVFHCYHLGNSFKFLSLVSGIPEFTRVTFSFGESKSARSFLKYSNTIFVEILDMVLKLDPLIGMSPPRIPKYTPVKPTGISFYLGVLKFHQAVPCKKSFFFFF